LNELVSSVLEDIDKKKFTFNIDKLPTILGNQVTVGQLIHNLLNNAVQHHTRDNGVVSFTVADKGKHYEFAIEDDGPGIDPAFKDRLFGIFQTYKPATAESTGIGLALCKKIVEENGGTIRCDSELGRGAKFTWTWNK
jgi:signal transduction histidine kinase